MRQIVIIDPKRSVYIITLSIFQVTTVSKLFFCKPVTAVLIHFHTNVRWFSDVFRGYKNGNLAWNGLRDHSFSTYTTFSKILTFLTSWYQEVRNVSFSENFVYVLYEWSLRPSPKIDQSHVLFSCPIINSF